MVNGHSRRTGRACRRALAWLLVFVVLVGTVISYPVLADETAGTGDTVSARALEEEQISDPVGAESQESVAQESVSEETEPVDTGEEKNQTQESVTVDSGETPSQDEPSAESLEKENEETESSQSKSGKREEGTQAVSAQQDGEEQVLSEQTTQEEKSAEADQSAQAEQSAAADAAEQGEEKITESSEAGDSASEEGVISGRRPAAIRRAAAAAPAAGTTVWAMVPDGTAIDTNTEYLLVTDQNTNNGAALIAFPTIQQDGTRYINLDENITINNVSVSDGTTNYASYIADSNPDSTLLWKLGQNGTSIMSKAYNWQLMLGSWGGVRLENPSSLQYNSSAMQYMQNDSKWYLKAQSGSRWFGPYNNGSHSTTSVSDAYPFHLYKKIKVQPSNVWNVWLSGDCGGMMSLYSSDANGKRSDQYLQVTKGESISLPSSVEQWAKDGGNSPTKYDYEIKGWYDVTHGIYYDKDHLAEVPINSDTVFYPEYVPRTYNIGEQNNDTVNSLDTNSFIRTDVFDYTNLINIGRVQLDASSKVDGTTHKEIWKPIDGSDGQKLMFLDYDKWGTISYCGTAESNKTHEYITGGILSQEVNKGIVEDLFSPKSKSTGVNYVGTGNYLYQYDSKTGFYYYNSRYNAASYNQSAERFYLYNYLERTSDSLKDGNIYSGGTDGGVSDFLPFNSPYANKAGKSTVPYTADGKNGYQYDAKGVDNGKNGAVCNADHVTTNYWFGMKSAISFYLPDEIPKDNDGSTSTRNQADGGTEATTKDMQFEFSGDDDVWVILDYGTENQQLLLDIGGVHGIMTGTVDFSTGVCTTSVIPKLDETGKVIRDAKNNAETTNESHILQGVKAGNHTLTMFYMERGSSQSNCSISFNLVSPYTVNLLKQDKTGNTPLAGATFGVYSDKACTIPFLLTQKDGTKTSVFTTDQNGQCPAYGFYARRDYYLRELSAPEGYPEITDKVLGLHFNEVGEVSSIDMGDKQLDATVGTVDQKNKQVTVTVYNEKPQKTSITAEKKWYSAASDGTKAALGDSDHPDSITVRLWRKAFSGTPSDSSESGESGSGTSQDSQPVNVTIKTQYFGKDNGTNMDDNPNITQGDLTRTVRVQKGGTLKLTIKDIADGQSDIYGIYSVTTDKGASYLPTAVPEGTSLSTVGSGNSVYAYGTWQPYRAADESDLSKPGFPNNAIYEIPISEATTVTVTLIGYMHYNSGMPAVSATITMDPVAIAPAGGGSSSSSGSGSSSAGQEGTVPQKKPADAVEVDSAELNTSNSWKKTWNNLPATDGKGKTYYYWVTEDQSNDLNGYELTITGNGTAGTTSAAGGTITLENVKPSGTTGEGEMTVEKKWLASGASTTAGAQEVQVQLMKDGKPVAGRVITLKASEDWKGKFDQLDKSAYDKYSVRELNTPDGWLSSVQITSQKTYTPMASADQVENGTLLQAVDYSKINTSNKYVVICTNTDTPKAIGATSPQDKDVSLIDSNEGIWQVSGEMPTWTLESDSDGYKLRLNNGSGQYLILNNNQINASTPSYNWYSPSDYAYLQNDNGTCRINAPTTKLFGTTNHYMTSSGHATTTEKANGGIFVVCQPVTEDVKLLQAVVTNTKITEPGENDKTEKLEHHKTIDYLGDGKDNPNTTADDQSQWKDLSDKEKEKLANANAYPDLYRLNLDVRAPRALDSGANYILVMDFSRSMHPTYNHDDSIPWVPDDTASSKYPNYHYVLDPNDDTNGKWQNDSLQSVYNQYRDQNDNTWQKITKRGDLAQYHWYDSRYLVQDPKGTITYNGEKYSTRYQVMKEVLVDGDNTLIDQILRKGTDNQMALIRFSDLKPYDYKQSSDNRTQIGQTWTDKPKAIKDGLSTVRPYGATNYDKALKLVKEAMENLPPDRKNRKTYLIFVSDGVPTCYVNTYTGEDDGVKTDAEYYNSSTGKTTGLPTDWIGGETVGNMKEVVKKTDEQIDSFRDWFFKEGHGENIHAIAFSNQDMNDQVHRYDNPKDKLYDDDNNPIPYNHSLKHLVNDSDKDFSNTLTGEDLREALALNWTDHVTISDTLSDYVELYTPQPDFRVDMVYTDPTTGKRNDPVVLWKPDPDNLKGVGKVTEKGKGIVQGVTWDETTKQVKVTFNPEYTLERGYTYNLSFNVEASNVAYNTYADNKKAGNNGYGVPGSDGKEMKGDEGTDYVRPDGESNKTSSEKYGFYSNASSDLTYLTDGKAFNDTYEKPVIQVGLIALKVHKDWTDTSVNHSTKHNPITVQLLANGAKCGDPVTLKDTGDDQAWTAVFSNLVPKVLQTSGKQRGMYRPVVYTLEETKVDGYTCKVNPKSFSCEMFSHHYEIKNGRVEHTHNNGEMQVITITNTEMVQKIKLIKLDEDGNPLDGAVFTLTDGRNQKINTSTSTSKGVIFEGILHADKSGEVYTLTETQAPEGYYAFKKPIHFKVMGRSIVLTDANGNLEKVEGVRIEKGTDEWVLKVKDKSIYTLPHAGSMGGTWGFTVLGTALLGFAVALWLIQRKEREQAA